MEMLDMRIWSAFKMLQRWSKLRPTECPTDDAVVKAAARRLRGRN